VLTADKNFTTIRSISVEALFIYYKLCLLPSLSLSLSLSLFRVVCALLHQCFNFVWISSQSIHYLSSLPISRLLSHSFSFLFYNLIFSPNLCRVSLCKGFDLFQFAFVTSFMGFHLIYSQRVCCYAWDLVSSSILSQLSELGSSSKLFFFFNVL